MCDIYLSSPLPPHRQRFSDRLPVRKRPEGGFQREHPHLQSRLPLPQTVKQSGWAHDLSSSSCSGKTSESLLQLTLCSACASQGRDWELLPQQVHPKGRHRPILRPQHPLQSLRYERHLSPSPNHLTFVGLHSLKSICVFPRHLQRRTSSPASSTSSPDAADTQSEWSLSY